MGMKSFGASVKRKEDRALVTGRGRFVDDIRIQGTLYGAVLRSPHAHARIRRIDTSQALAAPGVHLVLTAEDLGQYNKPLPLLVPNPKLKPITQRPLAQGVVRYVGEPVGFVVAESRYGAEDALDLIVVEYEALPAVVDLREAVTAPSAHIHETSPDNVAAHVVQTVGQPEAAFQAAEFIIKERLRVHRGSGQPMETRGVLADYDQATDKFTVWSSTQTPHNVRRIIAEQFDILESGVRVITPDVGGGFGPKAIFYPEEFLVPYASRLINQPVKWIEDRREHLMATMQERDQLHEVEVAFTKDGKILALRDFFLHDTGAYVPWGIIVPYITSTTIMGPYKIPNYRSEFKSVFTNKVPVTPHRGAGRPQAVFIMERIIDRIAQKLGLDKAEVRYRNFIQPDEFPYAVGLIYRDGSPLTYDSGNYPLCLQKALSCIDCDSFRQEQIASRQQGRFLGLGIGCYVEGTGLGPFEGATIRVHANGQIMVYTGAASGGQGHHTVLAQIVADQLGVDSNQIQMVTGDTDGIEHGIGTFGSRVAAVAGSAMHIAAKKLREKILQAAATMLEVSPEDMELEGGRVFAKGAPFQGKDLGELAYAASGQPGSTLPAGVDAGLEVTEYFQPSQATYSNGAHAAVVEVDPETGDVKILRYVVVHDCGRVINPMVVDGQAHGGVACGIGGSLYEEIIYDEQGQLLTGTYMDYLLPTALEVPLVELEHVVTPSPINPLGVKGTGEGGTIPALAALADAIEDALAPFAVKVTEIPLSPCKIREMVRAGAQ